MDILKNRSLFIIAVGGILGVFLLIANRPKVDPLDDFTNLDLNQNQNMSQPTDDLNLNLNQSSSSPTNTQPDVTELVVQDILPGNGPAVKSGDTISIHYLGTFTDGTKFDSSYDRGQPFQTQIGVGAVIPGWDQGIIGLQPGGKRRLVIPYQLAYGEQGIPGSIPPKATLIFEVELVSINGQQ